MNLEKVGAHLFIHHGVGNFGQKRDTSYYGKYPFLVRKAISMGRRIGDLIRHLP